jgi:uncharacterized protein involved in cysteine biosynthesis
VSGARPIPTSRLRRLAHGLELPFRALGLLVSTPALWPLAAAPVVLAGAGLAVGVLGGGWGAHVLLSHLWAEPSGAWAHLLWRAIHFTLYVVLVAASALIPPMVLAAPFLDRLSAGVEQRVLGTPDGPGGLEQLVREVLTSALNAVARLLRFGVVQALLFAFGFIPVVGVAYPVLAFVWSAIWLAEQALDQTASRHLFGWRDTRRAVISVRPAGFGMGLVLAAVFLVPLANLFLVPLATAAGALFYCDLRRGGGFEPEAK